MIPPVKWGNTLWVLNGGGSSLSFLHPSSFGTPFGGVGLGVFEDTLASPVSKGLPVKIPEQERWMGCPPLRWKGGMRGCTEGRVLFLIGMFLCPPVTSI